MFSLCLVCLNGPFDITPSQIPSPWWFYRLLNLFLPWYHSLLSLSTAAGTSLQFTFWFRPQADNCLPPSCVYMLVCEHILSAATAQTDFIPNIIETMIYVSVLRNNCVKMYFYNTVRVMDRRVVVTVEVRVMLQRINASQCRCSLSEDAY